MTAEHLIPAGDVLAAAASAAAGDTKQRLHYLLRDANLFDIAPAVLESVARIDGAIVSDAAGKLVAFGTILRTPGATDPALLAEGGRTTAALNASRFGKVLMVSEDGGISFFQAGRRVWQL